jgi:hypothetical protein
MGMVGYSLGRVPSGQGPVVVLKTRGRAAMVQAPLQIWHGDGTPRTEDHYSPCNHCSVAVSITRQTVVTLKRRKRLRRALSEAATSTSPPERLHNTGRDNPRGAVAARAGWRGFESREEQTARLRGD